MMTDPNMVFSTDPRHGLVARSGWEQEEARTVLRDLGWEWTEELHALVPPDDVPEVDSRPSGSGGTAPAWAPDRVRRGALRHDAVDPGSRGAGVHEGRRPGAW